MHRSHASAAVLGTSAALAAAFLAQPAPTFAATRDARANTKASATPHAFVGAAMRSLLDSGARHAAPAARTVAIAVCHDCPPSRALVRVLLRQQRHGTPLPPLRLFADHTWPALDTLARHSQNTVVVIRRLATLVGVTPAAITSADTTPAIGVHDVLALTLGHPMKQREAPR